MGTFAPTYKEYLSAKDWCLSLLAGGGTFLISIGSGKVREQLQSMQYGPLQFSSIEHELGNFISSKLRLLSFFSPWPFWFSRSQVKGRGCLPGYQPEKILHQLFSKLTLGFPELLERLFPSVLETLLMSKTESYFGGAKLHPHLRQWWLLGTRVQYMAKSSNSICQLV